MNIIEFYQKLSELLEKYRSDRNKDYSKAVNKLNSLLAQAKKSGLDVTVTEDVLKDIKSFDDEISYEEESYDESYEASYDDN